jgi:hypothetical protein
MKYSFYMYKYRFLLSLAVLSFKAHLWFKYRSDIAFSRAWD